MSDWIRKMLAGKGMNRREFMRGAAGTAAAAAANKVPVPKQPPDMNWSVPGNVALRSFGKDSGAGVWLEGSFHDSAIGRVWGNDVSGVPELSREDYVRLLQERNAAQRALADAPPLPRNEYDTVGYLQWNPAERKWERWVEPYTMVPDKSPRARTYTSEEGYTPLLYPEPSGPVLYEEGMDVSKVLDSGQYWEGGPFATVEDVGRAYGFLPRAGRPRDWEPGRKNANESGERLSAVGGGWHNIGGNPLESDRPGAFTTGAIPMQEPPPARSATTANNIRKLLGIAAPAAISAAAQGPVTREVVQ